MVTYGNNDVIDIGHVIGFNFEKKSNIYHIDAFYNPQHHPPTHNVDLR